MKTILILSLLLSFFCPQLFAETIKADTLPQSKEYQVISAKGKIVNKRTGKQLIGRSIFKEFDVLTFSAQDCRLAVIDYKQRSFIAKLNAAKSLGYELEPLQARINTRPGKILNYLSFRQFLNGRRLLVIGDTLQLEIAAEEFAMNKDSFFYIQYQWKGATEPINKRLIFTKNILIIDKNTLFTVDNKPIKSTEASDYKLFYFNKRTNNSTLINPFDIIFCNEAELKASVTIIVENFTQKPAKSSMKEAIVRYINSLYGEPEKELLDLWLKKHFNI